MYDEGFTYDDPTSANQDPPVPEAKDDGKSADHDQPYEFGHRPTTRVLRSFNTRQYALLLILRSRVQDGLNDWQIAS